MPILTQQQKDEIELNKSKCEDIIHDLIQMFEHNNGLHVEQIIISSTEVELGSGRTKTVGKKVDLKISL